MAATDVPAVRILVPLEGRPTIKWVNCRNQLDRERVGDWIDSHAELVAVVAEAIVVAEKAWGEA